MEATKLRWPAETGEVHGWLQNINNQQNMGSDEFALELGYDEVHPFGSAASPELLSDGNISWMAWHTKGNSFPASSGGTGAGYAFAYDALGRLVEADWLHRESSWSNSSRFDVGVGSNIAYDAVGNVTSLRRSDESGTASTISYTYESGSNRVDAVSGGYSSDYLYNSRGSVRKDPGRGISKILYNIFNRVSLWTVGSNYRTFGYDSEDRRVHIRDSQADTILRYYVRDSNGAVVAVYDGSGEIEQWNILAGGRQPIGRLLP